MRFKFFCLLLLFATNLLFAQKSELNSQFISDSLKQNSNAVVRLNQIDVTISSQRSMNIKTKRVITILNEKGQYAIDATEHYDKKTSVKSVEATVFDGFGNEIKKIKRKDFKDQSSVGGGTLFSDSRVMYLDYTPTQYPFTIMYESEVETSNTALIPQWLPLDNYYVSVEKSILNVNYLDNLGFKKKEFNLLDFQIQKTIDTSTKLSYTATNILSKKQEDYSPMSIVFPKVMMGLEHFNLEGEDGSVKDWKEYGKWFSEKILIGTTDLSEETKGKIKALVGTETDPISKAKIVYKYMQEKTRYVSVQVGIGGFRPMKAMDVDRLGYGDCKALSNYTRALLSVVDVPSYYTELYGSKDKMDIQSDFFSIQGNHVILCIPNKENYIWLECTSQEDPFGYQGVFTDDRNVLIIKPDGGEIVRTKIYEDNGNSQISSGSYSLSINGDLSGKVTIVSEGSQFSEKAPIENLQPADKETHYKKYWDNIKNLKINKIVFSNDKENVRFTENVEIGALNYGGESGDKMMFAVNVFNQYTGSLKRIRNRKTPFEIQRGFSDRDEIDIVLPNGFSVEYLPVNIEIKSKFGGYKTEFIKKDNNNLVYKRSLFIKKGLYPSIEYEEYRLFMEQVSRNDNSKIILTKNQL
jgi:hypothetical protein